MTKSELSDCGLIWNTSRNSICLDDFLKRYGISKNITIENKPNSCDVITETLHGMGDVRDFLTRMMTREIKLTKVEFEESTIVSAYPEIYVEYFVPTCATVMGSIPMPKDIIVDTCSIDDTIVYKHENKEPKKEETLLEFKEISW